MKKKSRFTTGLSCSHGFQEKIIFLTRARQIFQSNANGYICEERNSVPTFLPTKKRTHHEQGKFGTSNGMGFSIGTTIEKTTKNKHSIVLYDPNKHSTFFTTTTTSLPSKRFNHNVYQYFNTTHSTSSVDSYEKAKSNSCTFGTHDVTCSTSKHQPCKPFDHHLSACPVEEE